MRADPDPSPTPDDPKPPAQPAGQNPPGAPAPKKRRRRWPWILGAILLVLIVLVLLAPTLASMGWARSMIVGQVNHRLNGRVEIQDWSVGWLSGTKVDGLRVYDSSNRQILELPHLVSGLTVLDLVRGKYDLGNTVVDGLDLLVSREPDGTLNWEHLSKSGSKSTSSTENQKSKSTGKLPDVRGEILLKNCRATYEQPKAPPTYVRSLEADVKIPDINQPITNTLSSTVQIGPSGGVGKISMNGSVAAVKDNVVAKSSASADETLDLSGVDLAALPAFLSRQTHAKLAGQTNCHLAIKLAEGKSGSVQAQLAIKGASVSSESPGAQPVLSGYDLAFDTDATFSSAADGSNLKVTRLSLADNQKILSLMQAANQEISAAMPASGNPTASGAVQLFANLKRLNDVSQALSGAEVAVKANNKPEMRSGNLQGQIALAQASSQQVQLTGDLKLTDLTVASGTATPLNGETIQLTLRAMANHDLSDVQIPQLDAASDIVSAHGQMQLKLASGAGANAAPVPTLQKLRQAKLSVQVPSLPKVQALLDAFSPPSASQTTAGASKSELTGGAATLTLDAAPSGGGQALSPAMTVSGVTYKSGKSSYSIEQLQLVTQTPLQVTGDYPSGKLFNEAVRSLAMQGALQLKLFQGQGATIQNMDLPLVLQDGVVRVAYAGKPAGQDLPPPGSFNGGALNVGGCTIDLRDPHMRLSTPNDLKLVQNATLNPVFAAWSLGDLLNNPAFVGANRATGLLNVTINQCNRLPLDSYASSPNSDGVAKLDVSITDLHLGNPMLEQVADATHTNLDSFQGNVQHYQITIDHGITDHDLLLTVAQGKRPIHLFGKVRMADKELLPVTLELPWKLLGVKGVDQNVEKFLPEGIRIPLRGKLDHPQLAVDVNKLFQEATRNAIQQGILGGLGQPNTTQPTPQDIGNEIQKLIGGGKKKKK